MAERTWSCKVVAEDRAGGENKWVQQGSSSELSAAAGVAGMQAPQQPASTTPIPHLYSTFTPHTRTHLYPALSMLGCVLNWYPALSPAASTTRTHASASLWICVERWGGGGGGGV